MGVLPQARAKSAKNQSHSIVTPDIQQLQQEGFGPSQVRASGEFAGPDRPDAVAPHGKH